jgi:hypothetical protein
MTLEIDFEYSGTISAIDIIENAEMKEKWEPLQMLWSDLKQTGGMEDWMAFYKDNDIGER